MTIVEFFDGVSITNMVSCCTVRPDRIIFIGEKNLMEKQTETYRRFTDSLGLKVEFEFCSINKHNLTDIVCKLENIVETEPGCVFDLTGGEDLVLVAMGVVYERYKNTGKIKMHRFNINTGSCFDCDGDGFVLCSETPELSVADNIMVYGGKLISSDGKNGVYNWTLDSEFVSDLKVLWIICKENPRQWNKCVGILRHISSLCADSNNLFLISDMAYVETILSKDRCGKERFENFLKRLCNDGYILNYSEQDGVIGFCYKNDQIKKCLTTEGAVLELIVYHYAHFAETKHGEPKYNDYVIGAEIDWDSEIHDITDEEKDTKNEIDVLLMKGLVPIFISCKNGAFDENELYKLNTVAEKFGGPFAKKVLVVTDYGNTSEEKLKYLKQRITDMKIQLIDYVNAMDEKKFIDAIKNIKC